MGTVYNIKCIDKEKGIELVMPLEEMVYLLLKTEIDLSFHIEALKAQAIAIRTNLVRASEELEIREIDIDPSIKDEYDKKAKKAVEETAGIIITFNGKPIDAKYHIACGGSTENSENVLKNSVTYLRRVLCDYCENSPYWWKEKSFSVDEIEKLLKVKFPNVDLGKSVEIEGFIDNIEKDECGRIKSVKIGNNKFTGIELMELLSLDSTRFSIYPSDIKFISRGKGHGLGLCQYGANKMAEEGHSYRDILTYYYTGVEIESLIAPNKDKPLCGRRIMLDPGHGGEDTGYKGDSLGLLEKDITLRLGLKLRSTLESLGATVYMIRDDDTEVYTTKRLERANKIKPDFFISIHMDYFPRSTVKGVDMFHFQDDHESKDLGLCIFRRLKENKIPAKGVKEGNFYIFRGVSVSALLIEAGYLSNKEEEYKFNEEEYIEKIADAIAIGIADYFFPQ
jgi:stage II sporulation protein D